MKKYFEKVIANKEARCAEIKELIKNATSVDEVRSLGAEKEALEAEIVEARNQLAKVEETRFNPMNTYSSRAMVNDNMEYRMAFANYVAKGTAIPAELRANTLTSDVGTVIPENLIPQIKEVIESYGMVLPLLTKTSYAVGQTIALDGAKPVATWVAEGAGSTAQKKSLSGTIIFGAFKLRCEISYSQEVSVQTLPAFEALFVRQVGEAMAKAIEAKVVSDNAGADSPKGILAETGKSVEIAKLATGHFDYAALCAAEAELPQHKEAGAKWCMTKKTFMSIYSQVDSNGQPIGRINYGIAGKPERMLLGRDVVLVPYLPDYVESALESDSVVAFLYDFSDYVLNTSYDLGIQRKQDWDTEDHRVKAVMSVDGKSIDNDSLVKVVKKAA